MAPRKLLPTMSLEVFEDEILFTRAAVKADPDAADLLSLTDAWMGMVESARAAAFRAREGVADADGARSVANHRLDAACEKFGDGLLLAVGKDRASARWTRFFDRAVSRFIRMPLAAQVNRVKGWLTGAADAELDKNRTDLGMWTEKAAGALVATAGTATARGDAWIARDSLAEGLTAARDGLAEALASRARERNMGRDWPSVFFRTTPRRETVEELETAPAPATPATP